LQCIGVEPGESAIRQAESIRSIDRDFERMPRRDARLGMSSHPSASDFFSSPA
jgi:hypothetical protein